MIKSLKAFLLWFYVPCLLYYKTRMTDKDVRRIFSRMCHLDYFEPQSFEGFTLKAYGNSLLITQPDGGSFAINESPLSGKIYVNVLQSDKWHEVYRTHSLLDNIEWLFTLVRLDMSLQLMKIYFTRNKENLELSQQGIM